MAQKQHTQQRNPTHELGGGSLDPVRFIHDGKVVTEIDKFGQRQSTVTTEPGPGRYPDPVYYFRDSANGVQLCVQFPSGAVQILATEPA